MSTYDLGDVAALSVAITDTTGAAANAGAVALTITLPDGTTTAPIVTNPATGSYTAAYTPTQSGRFGVRWVATGVNACAFTDTFTVAEAGTPTSGVSYSGDPSTSDLDTVRFLIRDTDITDPAFTDAELLFLLTEWSDPYVAAWNAADTLTARYAGLADVSKSVGDLSLSTSYSGRAESYRSVAENLRAMATRRGSVLIYDTGQDAEQRFTLGQFDGT